MLISTDPINVAIYELRKQVLKSDVIANKVNENLDLTSIDNLTAPAYCSRFTRNEAMAARARGEEYNKE